MIRKFLSTLVLLSWGILILLWGHTTAQTNTYSSKVPTDYFANYKIQKDWSRLSELFVDIDAENKIWKINGSSTYSELLGIMKRIFPYFPQQDYSFQVVYKQCLKTTEAMQRNPNRENFSSFYENCKNPLANITTTIQNKYSVKAIASANPTWGPAPLTVTFDARTSKDPSNETIPARNYFWYYRDIDGIDKPIGVGPLAKHTFTEPGTYMVHLTVRSSNAGIFDGESTVSVNVSPKSAVVSIYANGKKMNKNKASKIWIQEAKKGVFFDGSATTPMWWREILYHKRSINSRDGFKWGKEGDGSPSYINVPLPGQGEYTVALTVSDNEKNTISEHFNISISDPVAIIQQTPEKGNTSTTYSFGATASYSLTSRLKIYTWELFDSEGNKLDTLQGKTIKKQFKKPWNYTVKLTVEDEMGLKNSDMLNVYVESTPPTPQFTITPTNKWQYPSEFFFDAKSSNDIDVGNGYDKLTYDWSFSNPSAVQISETEDNNKRITALFNETGKHLVTLKVSDNYGKTEEIVKEVNVESTLRPELVIRPKSAVWKTYVGFILKSNANSAPIVSYEWDFWDGSTPRVNKLNTMKYEYQKVWTYKVKVKVADENGNTNEVYSTVFIGEKDTPIIGYEIKDSHNFTLGQNDLCLVNNEKWGSGTEVKAYRINRQEPFSIDTTLSVNAQGNTNQLRHYFQAKNDEIIKSQQFSYKFNGIWCQYIDYTLEDVSLGKTTKERIWFKVVNALPKLDNVTLSFPQYGNEIWIGFQQGNQTQDIFASGVDPIIIKVNAQGAMDSDGSISYFKRYYYPKSNPNKIIETKITPGNIPYTFFSVPRQQGEFMFGVKMFDNDDGTQSSEEILGNGPIIVFPPDSKQPDIPLVTLKTDKINVEVWEEVTFDIISKILSDRSDFAKERTIQIDFDGDGEIDLTTKDDRVKHVYTKPSPTSTPYIPKAYVIYRDYKGMGESAPIVVKNGIKPALIYTSLGTTVLFKDVSLWEIIEREICLDTKECEKGNPAYRNTTLDKTFKVQYPKSGSYTVTMKVKDKNGNEATNTLKVEIPKTRKVTPIASGIFLISLPEAQFNDAKLPEIFVGKQLNNEVLFYIKTDETIKSCFVDSDITFDSNHDGDPKNDKDFSCNKINTQAYTPNFESVIGRVYYKPANTQKNSWKSRDFVVSFADFENGLDETTRKYYQTISELINTIDDSSSVANSDLRNLLILLRNTLSDKNAQRGSLIQIEEFLDKNEVKLSKKQQEKLQSLINDLSDYATLSAKGAGTYEVAKEEILSLLPLELKKNILNGFKRYEEVNEGTGGITEKKKLLESISATIFNHVAKSDQNIGENEIASEDFQSIIKPNLCKIANEDWITTQMCNDYNKDNPEYKAITETVEKPSSWLPTFLKILLWIVGIVVVSFIGLIVAFAVKAKLRERIENEEE